jgi:hypothetical protein
MRLRVEWWNRQLRVPENVTIMARLRIYALPKWQEKKCGYKPLHPQTIPLNTYFWMVKPPHSHSDSHLSPLVLVTNTPEENRWGWFDSGYFAVSASISLTNSTLMYEWFEFRALEPLLSFRDAVVSGMAELHRMVKAKVEGPQPTLHMEPFKVPFLVGFYSGLYSLVAWFIEDCWLMHCWPVFHGLG